MKTTIIRLTDELRKLDQDMIRLKEKVETVVRLRDQEKAKDEKDDSS
jgi:alpha-ketoglutarate-dependent taurine dioxygenase